MKKTRRLGCWLAAIVFFCASPLSASAGTYKWVDDKGITHYGDSIPPEYKDKANAELSKRGITIRKTDQALTPEQIRARSDAEARAKEEQVRAQEQRRRDQALLQSFTTERDIELKRDRDLQQIELGIANNQSVLKSTEKRLAENRTRAETLTKNGKPIPDGLKQDIESDESGKARLESLIEQKQQELGAVREKYEDFRRRFIELQPTTPSATAAAGATAATPAARP
jgi:chromosome segregation ATPase